MQQYGLNTCRTRTEHAPKATACHLGVACTNPTHLVVRLACTTTHTYPLATTSPTHLVIRLAWQLWPDADKHVHLSLKQQVLIGSGLVRQHTHTHTHAHICYVWQACEKKKRRTRFCAPNSLSKGTTSKTPSQRTFTPPIEFRAVFRAATFASTCLATFALAAQSNANTIQ